MRLTLPCPPDKATRCNCSICRRLGAVWAYFEFGTVLVEGHPGQTVEYVQGDRTLRTIRCKTCGVVTQWEPLPPQPGARHGVNLNNFEPKLLASVRIRRFDGADTWTFLDEEAPPMRLVQPSLEFLPSYVAALERGWSHDNERGAAAAAEELAQIHANPHEFVALLENRQGAGSVTLPDGSKVPRLPGFRRWMWDGEFCGSIGLRWQTGTPALPDYCLGHIGYAVVPWKQGRGYATQALLAMLDEARSVGLPFIEITTAVDNLASQRVIQKAGGVLHEEFNKPAAYGGAMALRFRIGLGN